MTFIRSYRYDPGNPAREHRQDSQQHRRRKFINYQRQSHQRMEDPTTEIRLTLHYIQLTDYVKTYRRINSSRPMLQRFPCYRIEEIDAVDQSRSPHHQACKDHC